MMSSNPNFKPCMIYAAELPAVFENTLCHDGMVALQILVTPGF